MIKMNEEKKPFLIINEEYDEIQINIKHTKPYMKLQQENQKYKEVIYKLKEWINIVQQNKDNKHLEPFISTDELDGLLDILNEVE